MSKSYVTSPSDIPDEPHYVIIEGASVYIPGDERSRTNPGHGYPASTEHFIRYIIFSSKEEWESEIQRRLSSKWEHDKNFRAVYVSPARVQTSVQVSVSVSSSS